MHKDERDKIIGHKISEKRHYSTVLPNEVKQYLSVRVTEFAAYATRLYKLQKKRHRNREHRWDLTEIHTFITSN